MTSSVSYADEEDEADLSAERRASEEMDMVISLDALDWMRYPEKRESVLIWLSKVGVSGGLGMHVLNWGMLTTKLVFPPRSPHYCR